MYTELHAQAIFQCRLWRLVAVRKHRAHLLYVKVITLVPLIELTHVK